MIKIMHDCPYTAKVAEKILTKEWKNILDTETGDTAGLLLDEYLPVDSVKGMNAESVTIYDYLYISCIGVVRRLTALVIRGDKSYIPIDDKEVWHMDAIFLIRGIPYPREVIWRGDASLGWFEDTYKDFPKEYRADDLLIDHAIRSKVDKLLRNKKKELCSKMAEDGLGKYDFFILGFNATQNFSMMPAIYMKRPMNLN